MYIKTIAYGLTMVLSAVVSYKYLENNPSIIDTITSNLKYIAPIFSTTFVGFILYVKTTLKELSKLDKLSSNEASIVTRFTSRCHTKLWLNVLFYALVLFYGVILPIIGLSDVLYKNISISIFVGLFILELLSLHGIYKLDKSIIDFQSYILIRAKKIEEKNAALAKLDKECQFSEKDKLYFEKRKNIVNKNSPL